MSDIEIIKKIEKKFNDSFETKYEIFYGTREEILRDNPYLKLNDNTLGVYKDGKIYLNSELITKIRNKNIDQKGDVGTTYLIVACFHELEHCLQQEHKDKLINQKVIYEDLYDIEKFLWYLCFCENDLGDYNKTHDNRITEIDADIKGVNNAISFSTYNAIPINEEFLNIFKMYNVFRENNYDPILTLCEINKKIKNNPELYKEILKQGYFSKINLLKYYSYEGNIISIDEIMNYSNEPLIPYIVSTPFFLESINNRYLEDQQIEFVINSISKVLNDYNEKKEVIENIYHNLFLQFDKFKEFTKISDKSSRNIDRTSNKKYYEYLENVLKELTKMSKTHRK